MLRIRIEEHPTVADLMDTRPISLSPDTDIFAAIQYLLQHKVTGAPVVDGAQRPLGVLGERSCLRLLAEGKEGDQPSGAVRDYMRTEFQAVEPSMDLYYVAGLYLNERNWASRRFLVVEAGKLVGVLTRYDVLRAVEVVYRQRRETP